MVVQFAGDGRHVLGVDVSLVLLKHDIAVVVDCTVQGSLLALGVRTNLQRTVGFFAAALVLDFDVRVYSSICTDSPSEVSRNNYFAAVQRHSIVQSPACAQAIFITVIRICIIAAQRTQLNVAHQSDDIACLSCAVCAYQLVQGFFRGNHLGIEILDVDVTQVYFGHTSGFHLNSRRVIHCRQFQIVVVYNDFQRARLCRQSRDIDFQFGVVCLGDAAIIVVDVGCQHVGVLGCTAYVQSRTCGGCVAFSYDLRSIQTHFGHELAFAVHQRNGSYAAQTLITVGFPLTKVSVSRHLYQTTQVFEGEVAGLRATHQIRSVSIHEHLGTQVCIPHIFVYVSTIFFESHCHFFRRVSQNGTGFLHFASKRKVSDVVALEQSFRFCAEESGVQVAVCSTNVS